MKTCIPVCVLQYYCLAHLPFVQTLSVNYLVGPSPPSGRIQYGDWVQIRVFSEALLGVLGIRYIYPKYFSYKV